jgi:hypothetical protein
MDLQVAWQRIQSNSLEKCSELPENTDRQINDYQTQMIHEHNLYLSKVIETNHPATAITKPLTEILELKSTIK